MKNKNNLISVGLVIVFTGIGFFAGVKYNQAKQPSFSRAPNGFARGANQSVGGNLPSKADSGSEMIRGKVVGKDDQGIALELDDGSSKLVLVSATTQINKAIEASIDDLAVDDQIMVFGQLDSSGAVTASQIQVNFSSEGFRQNMSQ